MALFSLLAVLAIPAALSIQESMHVTSAGQLLQQKLVLARQTAIARNRTTEIRFYKVPSARGGTRFSALQIYLFDEQGINVTPLEKMTVLPTSTIISDLGSLSSILQAAPHAGTQLLPSVGPGAYDFRSFRFVRGGATDLNWNGVGGNESDTWFLTIYSERDQPVGNGPPPNFYTLQVDPVSGNPTYFRP